MNQISPLAFVHPEAKLGDNNIIGPFCYIDKDTVLGDNNVLQNSVTIHVGARIGNNNEFFPGASISANCSRLRRCFWLGACAHTFVVTVIMAMTIIKIPKIRFITLSF